MFVRWLAAVMLAATVLVAGASVARAHCDTLDGPVHDPELVFGQHCVLGAAFAPAPPR